MYIKIIKNTKRQRIGQVIKAKFQDAYKLIRDGFAIEVEKIDFEQYVKSFDPCEDCKKKEEKKGGCGCGSK